MNIDCTIILASQGKTVVQAEIDAAAELIDFFRFNAKHAVELETQQPLDAEGSTNTMLYRGLEVGTSQTGPFVYRCTQTGRFVYSCCCRSVVC